MYSGSTDISETTAASENLTLKYIPENRSILHWHNSVHKVANSFNYSILAVPSLITIKTYYTAFH